MKTKSAAQIEIGDNIEAASGMFTVTDRRDGLGPTVLLRGTVGGVSTDWTAYDAASLFEVVTVH
jgi:hypothetical protein